MQFVANGPDIPDRLLQAHEDGGVVLFCGAGISYPAGLPGFKGLVDAIYEHIGTNRDDVEQDAYVRGQFDSTLNLLEQRAPGQRSSVRKALAAVLQPDLSRPGATETHAALLQLASNRDRTTRLVTTNFDRVFEHVRAGAVPAVPTYQAPLLPIPKRSRWSGLVYLHGLLPDGLEESELNRLVLTSGDFGLAYLTERWASRFVADLFRSYTVCFVGYSINDPVLRYMMDALAADRMQGEPAPEAFAFGDCAPADGDRAGVQWRAKGATPILYHVPAGSVDHSALYRTLKAWGETHRDGILGKERIVVEYAIARPSASTAQDDFVGRMLWALSDESGLPAKRFAEFEPVPALEWLKEIAGRRYQHADLGRFGVPACAKADDGFSFSLLHRPAPPTLAPWMALVSPGQAGCRWDARIHHLARWLVRHLDDPELILWLAEQGGRLHEQFARLVEAELNRFSGLERQGKAEELGRIRAQSPRAIPRPPLRRVWRLLLTNRIRSPEHGLALYRWKERLERDGLSATLRFELREVLTPMIALEKPFRWRDDGDDGTPNRLTQLVRWELVLASREVRHSLHELQAEVWGRAALPGLLADFQQLLIDALELASELDEGDDFGDRSHRDLPSIAPHWQNETHRDWAVLIELVRDAWLAVREVDAIRAARVAEGWFAMPHTALKRLALFAASYDGCTVPDRWAEWLAADNGRCLWSEDTRREAMRLLVLQGLHLTPQSRDRLEAAILSGPPRQIYDGELGATDWQYVVDHFVWLRLAKLRSSGGNLGSAANQRLVALSAAYPEWRLLENERDEFSQWWSGTGAPDFEDYRRVDRAPLERRELVAWLKETRPAHQGLHDDDWGEACRTRFGDCEWALRALAEERQWPTDRWRGAFHAWSEQGQLPRSWRCLAPLVHTMPDDVLKNLAFSVTWWLRAAAESLDCHDSVFLDLCRRMLALPHEHTGDGNAPLTQAINHPVGHVAQALLNLWFRRKPNDNGRLPADLEPLFTQLCNVSVAQFRPGRVLLASRVIPLFRVDRPWTEANLLPLFQWAENAVEARATWEGFLWSPRLYPPLMVAMKGAFLETARHYDELGEHARQFSMFLTYAALYQEEPYTVQDFRTAFGALPWRNRRRRSCRHWRGQRIGGTIIGPTGSNRFCREYGPKGASWRRRELLKASPS